MVTDPHEIANVCGEDGINYMMQKTKKLPISVYFMIPSCVPATEFDESAAKLNSIDVANCFEIDNERILGLAEMMNYPGVLAEDSDVIQKIAQTYELGKRVDGHAPGLTGEELKEYAKVNKGIDAFMNLSFVSLPVIGDVRLLPSGAFNVKEWRIITQQELDQSWKQKNGNTQSDKGER